MRRPYIVLAVCLGSLLLAAPAGATTLSATERALLNEINRVRISHGLVPLTVDPRLQQAARAQSLTMLRRGYFGHGSLLRRLQRYGAAGPRLAENLAWAQGARASPTRIVANWLRSPSHRANLLRPGFRRVGVGARRGTFAGRPRTLVVTVNFAGR